MILTKSRDKERLQISMLYIHVEMNTDVNKNFAIGHHKTDHVAELPLYHHRFAVNHLATIKYSKQKSQFQYTV